MGNWVFMVQVPDEEIMLMHPSSASAKSPEELIAVALRKQAGLLADESDIVVMTLKEGI